jgi:hypothetical protein
MPPSDRQLLPDPHVVQLCSRCMADAAQHCSSPEELTLTETALARDLADAVRTNLAVLLDQAWRDAVAYLDALESDAGVFAV